MKTSLNDLFAKIPKGKNSIKSTIELYDEKNFYYNDVYPGGNLPWLDKPFDFINENPLYGKVDLNGNYIIPNDEKMLVVNANSPGVRVFDFVAEAFNDLRENVHSLVKTCIHYTVKCVVCTRCKRNH